MMSRGVRSASLCLLGPALLLAALLAGCKDRQPPPAPAPAKPAVQPRAEPLVTRDQAMAALLALPEVQAWSADIDKRSRGKAKGAIIEDNPTARTINGREYWQLSFVEDRKEAVHRRESFLVAKTGGEILVEDVANDTVLSLDDWRRGIKRVQTKSLD